MSATLSAYEWLQTIGLGGLCGILGQGARMVVGLKKLHDASNAPNGSVSDLIEVDRLLTSLAIGFIAGALAAITTIQTSQDLDHLSLQQILALIGAGYAGTDFIEGLISRVRPAPAPSGGAAAADGAVG